MNVTSVTRRNALLTSLFGAGYVGLRALATGLPVSFLLNPRRALASGACTTATKARFVIFNTSGNGDPINASVPGTYEDPKIVHSTDPTMAPTKLTVAGTATTAAAPWAMLPQSVLDQTQFWHVMTNTPVHPKEPQVLELMGATQNGEMFPSVLAKALAPCLGTIQPQPLSVGATNPSESLQYGGATQPTIPPTALRATLTNAPGPLTNLQSLRDQTMNSLYALYKNQASPAQQAYIDSLVTSQTQVRNINQGLLDNLASITDNSQDSQILAALTLIQMNVAPVIAIHIDFGGDNHRDVDLANETTQTVAGVASIGSLMSQLQKLGLQDKVCFMTLNVFGRTIGPGNDQGRAHNPNHHVALAIGSNMKGGIYGAVQPVGSDYGCTPMSSQTGAGGASGDIVPTDTLAAWAQTMLVSVGADPSAITSPVNTAKPIMSAIAPT
jgi:hypothetical protein